MLVMEYLRQFTWVLRHHTEASDLVDVFVRHHARLSDRSCRAFRKQQVGALRAPEADMRMCVI